MKVNKTELNKLIAESIKKHLLSEESGYYPLGAEYDSRAPWNQRDPQTDEDEIEEKFPTIPFILMMINEWVDNGENAIELVKQGLGNSYPHEVIVYARYSYVVGCEPPDEDGYCFNTREDEEQAEAGVYFIINGKYVSLIDWVNNTIPQDNELHQYLSEAYEGVMDLLTSDSPTAEDMEGNIQEMKQRVQQIQASL